MTFPKSKCCIRRLQERLVSILQNRDNTRDRDCSLEKVLETLGVSTCDFYSEHESFRSSFLRHEIESSTKLSYQAYTQRPSFLVPHLMQHHCTSVVLCTRLWLRSQSWRTFPTFQQVLVCAKTSSLSSLNACMSFLYYSIYFVWFHRTLYFLLYVMFKFLPLELCRCFDDECPWIFKKVCLRAINHVHKLLFVFSGIYFFHSNAMCTNIDFSNHTVTKDLGVLWFSQRFQKDIFWVLGIFFDRDLNCDF